MYHLRFTKCDKLCSQNIVNKDGTKNKLYLISYLQSFQSTVIGHLGFRLNLVQNLVVSDKRYVKDHVLIPYRDTMGPTALGTQQKSFYAILQHVQVEMIFLIDFFLSHNQSLIEGKFQTSHIFPSHIYSQRCMERLESLRKLPSIMRRFVSQENKILH